jgi:hypothetical protein
MAFLLKPTDLNNITHRCKGMGRTIEENMRQKTELKYYQTVTFLAFLYGTQTWTSMSKKKNIGKLKQWKRMLRTCQKR